MEKYAEICIRLPVQDVARIRELLKASGHVVDISEMELYPAEEVFLDSHPGKILRVLSICHKITFTFKLPMIYFISWRKK